MLTHPMTRKREAAGLTRGELARAAEVTRQTIHRIERWEQRPSIRLMEKLRDALAARGVETSADDFMKPADEVAASSVEGHTA